MHQKSIGGFNSLALKKYFKNTGMLFLGRIGSLMIKMLVGILVANYLGREHNGILVGGTVYVYFFSAIASLGLDQFIVKELHQFPEDRNQILGTSFILKLMAGICCIPLIWFAFLYFPAKGTPSVFILLLSGIGAFQSFTVIDAYFQSQVQAKYIMRVQIVAHLISAAIKLLLIIYEYELIYFVIAYTIDFVLIALGYFIAYQQKVGSIFQWRFEISLAKKLLTYSWPLIISGIMVALYMKIDQFMIQNMKGLGDAGAYATVVQFSEAWNFVPLIIVSSLFPAILNAKRDDEDRYKKRLQNLYDLMVYLSVPVAILFIYFAPYIYKLYKPEYAYAADVLAVHIWSGVFVFLGVASGQYLIVENFVKVSFIRTGFGALVNIILNLVFIPKFGMMGAAIATLIAYASANFMILFIPKLQEQGLMMLKSLFLISLFQKFLRH